MSYTTITASTNDVELRDRIRAAIGKESWANEAYGATGTGSLVRDAGPDSVLGDFMWPCCIDFEEAYAYAVDAGNEHPGGDPGVIPDAAIQSAVQVHWPDPPAPAAVGFHYDATDPMAVVLDNVPDGSDVDWGDGATGGTTHTFSAPGTHQVVIVPPGGDQTRLDVEVPDPAGGTP